LDIFGLMNPLKVFNRKLLGDLHIVPVLNKFTQACMRSEVFERVAGAAVPDGNLDSEGIHFDGKAGIIQDHSAALPMGASV
jgi:hypothetical protein